MAVSFKQGYKFVDGERIAPVARRTYTSSNGYTIYTAVMWADGNASCNCPGWSFRKKCKHASEVGLYQVGSVPTTAQDLAAVEAEAENTLRRRIRM